MTNTNCLEGVKCPECASEGPFSIAIDTIALVYDSGTDDYADHEWYGDSYCRCVECDHVGTVADFTAGGNHNLSPAAEAIKELLEVCKHAAQSEQHPACLCR